MKLVYPNLMIAVQIAISSVACAESTQPSPFYNEGTNKASAISELLTYNNGHFYFGGRAGWVTYQDACGSSVDDCKDDTLGYGLYGGYQFNTWSAVEGGVTAYGSPNASYSEGDLSAEVNGGELALKLSYPLSERLGVFSRLGGAYQVIDKSTSMTSDSVGSKQLDAFASLGIDYRLSQNWSLRGEYQLIDGIGDGVIGQSDLHFMSLGLTYHFNQVTPAAIETIPTAQPTPHRVMAPPSIPLSAAPLFDFDSFTLNHNTGLELLADHLAHYPKGKVRIVGHTDNVGTSTYNQILSEKRAQSVANYLKRLGVSESRLLVVGMGESSPVASNDTAFGRAQNRRVEVIFDIEGEKQESDRRANSLGE